MVMGRDARGKVGGEMGVRPQAVPELGLTSPSTKVFNNIINSFTFILYYKIIICYCSEVY